MPSLLAKFVKIGGADRLRERERERERETAKGGIEEGRLFNNSHSKILLA